MARIKFISVPASYAAAGCLFLFFPGGASAADSPSLKEAELRVVPALTDSTSPAAGLQPFREGELWGYRNAASGTVISPVFDLAEEFRDGLAPVMLNGKWGYIDASGGMRLEPRYDGWNHFSGGRASVKLKGEWVVIDASGTVVERPFARDRSDLAEGLAFFKSGEKFGYLDPAGAVKIAPAFDDAREFSEGLAAVRQGKWGFIDKNGKFAVRPGFEAVGPFREGLAAFLKEGAWGFLDKKGREAIANNFDDAGGFSGGLAAVRLGPKWGYIDKMGRIAIRPQYASARDFSGGRAVVTVSPAPGKESRRWIDAGGGTLFQSSGAERDGMQPVVAPDGRYGYAGSTDIAVAPGFEEAKACLDKLCLVKKAGKYIFIDYAGAVMLETSYDDASEAFCGSYRVKRGGKYGFIDSAGAVAVPLIYDVLETDACRDEIKAVLEGRPGVLRRTDHWRFVQDGAPAPPAAETQAPGGTAAAPQTLLPAATVQAPAAETAAVSTQAAPPAPDEWLVRENRAGHIVAFELNVKPQLLPVKTPLPVSVVLKRRFNGKLRLYSGDMNKLVLLDVKKGEYLKSVVVEANGPPGRIFTIDIGLQPAAQFPGLLLGAEVVETASLRDTRYHAIAREKQPLDAPPGGDWFSGEAAENLLLLPDRFGAARGIKLLSSDPAAADRALPQLVRWFTQDGTKRAAAESGLKTIVSTYGCAGALPHMNALLRDNDLRNRIKWLEALRLCGPDAKAAAEEIKALFDDDDKTVRDSAFGLYRELGLAVPPEYAAAAGLPAPAPAAAAPIGAPAAAEASISTVPAASTAPAAGTAAPAPAEYAAAVSTADAARMEAVEKALEAGPTAEGGARLFLELGRLKKAAENDPEYARRRPGEYGFDEPGGRYIYNGKHFMQALMRHPQAPEADEAAYALTELSQPGGCGRYTACRIEQQFGQVYQFLKDRPDSGFAEKGIERANSAFTANLKDIADYNAPGPLYDPQKTRAILQQYDDLASQLPKHLRPKACLVIAGLWTNFRNYPRARHIYEALLADAPDPATERAVREGLAAIPSEEPSPAPIKLYCPEPPVLKWTALEGENDPEYAVYRSTDILPGGREPSGFSRLARVQGNMFGDVSAKVGTLYWYYVEAVTPKGTFTSNKAFCSLVAPQP